VRKLLLVFVALLALTLSVLAQGRGQPVPAGQEGVGSAANGGGRFGKLAGEFTPVAPPEIANMPTPRLPDGTPDMSGPWVGGGSNGDIERDGGLKPGELPLLPWAKQLKETRREEDEPYLYCTPMGIPRVNPYPWRFVQNITSKGIPYIFVIHENGDAGGHRVIFMDGRKHPPADEIIPSWWGHSIGRWEKDTLIIDTVGINDKFWFDSSGTPHTDQLHTIERWTRINYGNMNNEFTLDDPGAFSRPVNLSFKARALPPGAELMEFICTENNQYGTAAGIPNIYKDKGYGLEVPVPKR
jgi:hypothetical protein